MFTVKVSFRNEKRRFSFSSRPSFSELEAIIRERFHLVGPITLKYEDEEHDLVTFSSNVELSEAFSMMSSRNEKLLRLSVSTNEKKEEKEESYPNNPKESKKEEENASPQANPLELLHSLFTQFVDNPRVREWVNNPNVSQFASQNPFLEQLFQQFQTKCNVYSDKQETSPPMEQEKCSQMKEQETQEKPIHRGIICDNCEQTIVGIRYKCFDCPDYDLCETCQPLNVHDPQHSFLEIKNPLRRHRFYPYQRWRGPCRSRCPLYRPVAEETPKQEEIENANIDKILELGFNVDRELVKEMLTKHNNDVQRVIEELL